MAATAVTVTPAVAACGAVSACTEAAAATAVAAGTRMRPQRGVDMAAKAARGAVASPVQGTRSEQASVAAETGEGPPRPRTAAPRLIG